MTVEFVLSAPRGFVLRRVAYVGFEWDDLLPVCQGFDQVSLAVTLDFGRGGLFVLRWLLREPFECITAEFLAEDPVPQSRVVDASERWGHLLGARVVAQRVSMQDTAWGLQPWSVRLGFDNGCDLVVCLGESTPDGTPTYTPDSLLITDSKRHALAYHPRAALTSAWD